MYFCSDKPHVKHFLRKLCWENSRWFITYMQSKMRLMRYLRIFILHHYQMRIDLREWFSIHSSWNCQMYFHLIFSLNEQWAIWQAITGSLEAAGDKIVVNNNAVVHPRVSLITAICISLQTETQQLITALKSWRSNLQKNWHIKTAVYILYTLQW